MNVAEKLYQFYCEKKKKQPYHINVIDELHANENAHSRILIRFLQYQKGRQSFILKSFLNLLLSKLSAQNQTQFSEIIKKADMGILPEINFNRDYIDCLISWSTEYAIIIENKIHWAGDQWEQIQRYIDTAILHGVKSENIYVVYLTANENKIVSEYSFTEQAKKCLDTTENDMGRFLPMTYMSDILPWLENEILPTCTIGEEWLISALRQYIDHLKGLFGLRDFDKEIWLEIKNKLTSQAIRDAALLSEGSAEKNFMEDLILRTKYDLERCFCDRVLNFALCQKGLRNPGGWYPDFGEKWGCLETIEASNERNVVSGLDLEKFWYGIGSKESDHSKDWNDAYWKNLRELFPAARWTKWYWLGGMEFGDKDFCSTELLIQVLEENNPNWEQSVVLQKKASKFADEVSIFFSAVIEAERRTNTMIL